MTLFPFFFAAFFLHVALFQIDAEKKIADMFKVNEVKHKKATGTKTKAKAAGGATKVKKAGSGKKASGKKAASPKKDAPASPKK